MTDSPRSEQSISPYQAQNTNYRIYQILQMRELRMNVGEKNDCLSILV